MNEPILRWYHLSGNLKDKRKHREAGPRVGSNSWWCTQWEQRHQSRKEPGMFSQQKTSVGSAEGARGRVQQDEFGDMQGPDYAGSCRLWKETRFDATWDESHRGSWGGKDVISFYYFLETALAAVWTAWMKVRKWLRRLCCGSLRGTWWWTKLTPNILFRVDRGSLGVVCKPSLLR